ncbi:AMP-binding protein [Gynuella sp.]|uniref:AMP-binding protein n=1 Tax=Gynuella sp. TaxID=2969146 RepID=UPI003D11B3C9
MNITHILLDRASQHPDTPAIIDKHRKSIRLCNYQQLADAAGRTAAMFRHYGLGKGDRVLVFQTMSYELYVVLLALFQLGAVAMFLDPSAGRQHIDQCCELGRPRALIASAKAHLLRLLSSQLRRIPIKFSIGFPIPGAVSLAQADSYIALTEIGDCADDDPALLTFTSGSTGRPKAAQRSHGFLLAQHAALQATLNLQPGDVDLTTLPVFLLANLASGITSVIPDADLRAPGQIDAAPVIAQIQRHQVNRTAGSPAFYQRLLEYCAEQNMTLPGLKHIGTGGAPVFPELLRQLQEMAPNASVAAVYGSTEAEPMAEIDWQQISDDDLKAMRQGQGLLTGHPVEAITLRVIKDRFGQTIGPFTATELEQQQLAAGVIGEIVVSGDHVLPGYLHGEGDNDTKFDVEGQHWHRTGDAGFFDTRGRLWLVGRSHARIEDSKGILYPFTVECAAHFFPQVRRSAMMAWQGKRILLIEADAAVDLVSLNQALDWAQLDDIRRVRSIPVDRRHNAKIDYTRLQKLLE